MTAEEKRSDPRKSVNRTISFELLVTEKNKLKNMQVKGLCSDISHQGLGLTTDCLLKEGNVLKLYFPLSELGTALPLYAKVMWSRSADSNFRAGLQFIA